MKLKQMKAYALRDLCKYIKENNLSVEDIAYELEMTPSILQQKMQSMDYSFLNAVNDCCKKMVEAEKRSLKNEHK